MYSCCVDSVLEFLEQAIDEYDAESVIPIQNMHLDLKFFRMFLIGMAYQEEVLDDYWHCVLCTMVYKFNQAVEEFSMKCLCAPAEELIDSWELLSFRLRKRIEKFKPLVREICILLLGDAFKGRSFQFQEAFLEYSVDTSFLISLIIDNLHALSLNMDLIAPVKEQIAFIQGKLEIFGKFSLNAHISSSIALRFGKLICQTQAWVDRISCLTTLYWADEMDERLGSVVGNMLSDLMQIYMPHTPGVLSMYFDMFIEMRSHMFQSDTLSSQQFLRNYVDYLLERLVVHTKDTEVLECFRHALVCLLSLEMRYIFRTDIYGIINEVTSVICSSDMIISDLVHKIDQVLRESYVFRPLSSDLSSPKINVIGFLDYLIRNLRKMLARKTGLTPFIWDHIEMVRAELETLQLHIQFRLELETEKEVVVNLCARIANVVYFAAYITNLCSGTSFWVSYGINCLPNLIEDIKLVKSEVIEKIGDGRIYIQESYTSEMEKSNKALLPQATTSRSDRAFIGYEQDADEILNHLVRGTKELRIISISGMPGQGKTTLAKRMYNDPSVHLHFHQKVWCYVSKECNLKALLMNIAGEIGCSVDVTFEIQDVIEIQDLIEHVCRSLRGKRYLIIMDDIWDVDVWRQVGGSFPNDTNGSRVLFTSRNHELALKAEPNSISYPLRPFTDEESWTLMKVTVSNCDGLPEAFLDIGEQIAVYCKGLPLAVVLIASHLKKVGQVLILWKEAAENLKLHLADEGCMHIIEMSYRYLPDHLKQCFLYLGAFPRGENIRVRKLKRLWIAEGFLKENEMKSLDDLANEYLDSLVSQSLVVVTERSSTGWIKSCNVHDLLYDLCLEKGVLDNFIDLAADNIVSDAHLHDTHHRLFVHRYDWSTLSKSNSTRKNLPTTQIHTLLVYDSDPYESESLSSFLGKFKVLTVLDLNAIIWDMFAEIFSNVHLRYLALIVGKPDNIPSSIAGLWNLETLIMIGHCSVLQLPNTLWEMESLKYVHIERSRLVPSVDPYISIAATCSIEVLKGIILKYDFKTEEFLGRLVQLRKLRCYVGDHDSKVCSLWFSMFGSLEKLESLHIKCYGVLVLYHQLPTIKFPNSVKKLTLESPRLPWSVMSIIGKLPNLEVLKLRNMACSGSTWHLGDDEFSKLKCLRLSHMYDVEQIDDSDCEYPFPCLEKLFMVYCEKLKEIPLIFGDICTLDTIDITDSPNLRASVKLILEQQLDMGNNYLRVLGLEDDHTDDEGD